MAISGMRQGTEIRRKRERSIILTKHEIHLLSSSSPIPPKEKYKLFLKLERISKHLLNDLLVIMNSKHLERWNADHGLLWKRINAQVHRFVTILPALNLEVATVYRFKIRWKKIGKERYYWKERDNNSSFSENMEKPTWPIIGIKGGYIRRALRAAVEHNIIPNHESKAVTLSEIRRRLRTEASQNA